MSECLPWPLANPNKHKVVARNEHIYMSESKDSLMLKLADLLQETAEMHHKAFANTDGVDDDWPVWYADHLLDKIRKMFNLNFSKSELIHNLVSAEIENKRHPAGASWPIFYARFIVNTYK